MILSYACCKIKHKISGTPPAYLQEVTPWNQLSSCWENNQSAAFMSIKSIFFTNLDKRVQLHQPKHPKVLVNIFDPSRIGQELRLRAWQKRHQGPTYESQGGDVLGCLRWTEGEDLLMVGLFPMQNSSTFLSTKMTQRSHCFSFSLS